MPISHSQLLECMNSLGYQIDEKGMCFGFTHMALSAVLLGDIATYNRRLAIINEIYEDKTRNLETEIEAVRELVKAKTSLTPDQEIILSIPAFFDGVSLYHQPEVHQDLFELNSRLFNQQADKIFPLILPTGLMNEKNEVNIDKIAAFSGIYDNDELLDYFNVLHKTLLEQQTSVSLVLSNMDHAFLVSFDPVNDEWIVINSKEAERIWHDRDLTVKVLTYFSNISVGGITPFAAEVYTTKPNAAEAKKSIDNLKASPIWNNLHTINSEKIERVGKNNNSWLLIACKAGQRGVVESLLTKKADVNRANVDGITPLIVACELGHHDIATRLLDSGANINQANIDGGTPLATACVYRHSDVVELLLKRNAKTDLATSDGIAPLHIACLYGSHEIAKLLIEANANVNQTTNDGYSPLYLACELGFHEVVNLLLNKDASYDTPINASLAILKDKAEENNCTDKFIKLLDKNNISHSSLEKLPGFTPLDAAIFFGHTEVVKSLLAHANFPSKTENWNVIDLALAMNRTEIAELITEHFKQQLKQKNTNNAAHQPAQEKEKISHKHDDHLNFFKSKNSSKASNDLASENNNYIKPK